MKKQFGIISNGRVTDVETDKDITSLFRRSMIVIAEQAGQALAYDPAKIGRAHV